MKTPNNCIKLFASLTGTHRDSRPLYKMLVSVSLATVDEWCLNDEKEVHLLER